MRLHEFANPNDEKMAKKKTKLLYEDFPPAAIMPQAEENIPTIFGLENHDSSSMRAYRKCNSAHYQKMLNWD